MVAVAAEVDDLGAVYFVEGVPYLQLCCDKQEKRKHRSIFIITMV
jgi:hypothetical protein